MRAPELIAAAGGILVGGGIGILAGIALVENKLREEYLDAVQSYKRAIDLSRDMSGKVDGPADFEIGFNEVAMPEGEAAFAGTNDLLGPDGVLRTGANVFANIDEPVQNDYHKAIAAVETPIEKFVDGGVNDYGISYIEEEEYFDEEDGRFKGQIIIMLDETNPTFLMDGVPITDWDKRIGDSILVDFYKLVPPGVDQVLYVRNHRSEEDYEVLRESP